MARAVDTVTRAVDTVARAACLRFLRNCLKHKNYTGQQISNNFFVSVMNMLLIYLFASMKLENGHKKDYLVLVLKLCFTVLFYKIG